MTEGGDRGLDRPVKRIFDGGLDGGPYQNPQQAKPDEQ